MSKRTAFVFSLFQLLLIIVLVLVQVKALKGTTDDVENETAEKVVSETEGPVNSSETEVPTAADERYVKLEQRVKELEDQLEEALQQVDVAANDAINLQNEIDLLKLSLEDYEAIMSQIRAEEGVATAYEEAMWDKKYQEYPTATTVWLYLTRELEYSNYVAAGILGNMMLECGGNSLKLQYNIYNASRCYYGLCQWNIVAKDAKGNILNGKVKNADLKTQLNYLSGDSFGSIEYAFGHSKLISYENFLTLTSCEKAAEMFAKVYEVCGNTYYTRGVNALRAYQYFVTD